ncbi:hypothetical protein UFOVP831_43 [uncultured Caudovirales phage]|uniref:Uncharacterized protein n=1 Tax=uncultured Caudovirales phage TaxID=2100421 RepID=A0A6J5P5T6_9CAUD|nr:hypothetical protein UFOVP831_43 [uncultured Caudovirales phage]
MKQNLKAIEQNLIKDLKKKVKKDSEIIVVIHKVSKSGMQRKMTAFVIYKKQLVNLNFDIARLDIARRDDNNHLVIGGCGMDMAFDLTYRLKTKLYGYNIAIKNQQYRTIY